MEELASLTKQQNEENRSQISSLVAQMAETNSQISTMSSVLQATSLKAKADREDLSNQLLNLMEVVKAHSTILQPLLSKTVKAEADAASITAEQKYASLSGEFTALQSQRQKLDASFKQAVADLHSGKEENLKLKEEKKYASLSGEFTALQSQRQKLDASFKQAIADLHSGRTSYHCMQAEKLKNGGKHTSQPATRKRVATSELGPPKKKSKGLDFPKASQPVGVMGLNPNKVLTATRGIEVIEEDRSSLQNNSGGDIDNDGSSTLEDIENTEGSQCYQDEEVATAKLILILRKWRRHCSLKRELGKKKQIEADTALSLLSLGPSIRHYEEQQSTSGEFNLHLIMKERQDKHERSWSKLNVSEVVAGRLSERNASSKCLCWKVVLCSQIDGSDRSSLSGSAAGSWLYSKILPAGDHNDEDLITSSTDLSIWKKWINDLSSDEPICCLSIIKDARCDNLEENVAGANAVMFLVYECIPLRLQKQRLHNLVMALPSGSSVPLLILSGSYKSHSDPSFIANELGLNEVGNSRISCFSVVFLLENQNTVSHDGFFSDIILREGLEWLASRSPKQPVLQSVKTRELVFTHLDPLMEVLNRRSAYTITPTHCVSAFNEALKQSVEEVVAAVDANPLGWPCPEVALLEKSSDVYRAVNLYLPRVGWSSAAEVEPLASALKQCKLPSFSDDMTWLFSGSGMDHDNIENHKSRLEDCLTRYLTQTSQMMGFSLAKQEAHVMVQKFARPELHESTYYIVLKWALIFRRVFNWRLNRLNGEISRAYVLKQNDTAVVTNMGVDIVQDEGVVFNHSIIEPSLDELLQVSCSLGCYPESEASQPVGVMGLNPNKVLTATRGIEVIEEDRSSLQNNSGGDIDNDGNMNPANSTSKRAVDHVTNEADRLSKLLEKCNAVQNMIDKKLSIYF